jgi:hypothetical protein
MLFTSCAKTIMFILMTLHNMHLIVTNTALIMNIKLVGNKGGELLGSNSVTDALQRMQLVPAEGKRWCLHCRGGFRSEARYIVSEDTAYSKGVGWVTSLAGIMKFSKLTIAPTCSA